MCVIIDTNCLPQVLDKDNKDHEEFKPVHDWVFKGSGKILYGGSKYNREIGKYLDIFAELNKANKAISFGNEEVDLEQKKIESKIPDKDFDDPHLISLLLISKCKLICSLDKRAYPYFKNSVFFKGKAKPKIYCNARNKNLLKNKYVAEICKCKKINTK